MNTQKVIFVLILAFIIMLYAGGCSTVPHKDLLNKMDMMTSDVTPGSVVIKNKTPYTLAFFTNGVAWNDTPSEQKTLCPKALNRFDGLTPTTNGTVVLGIKAFYDGQVGCILVHKYIGSTSVTVPSTTVDPLTMVTVTTWNLH